MDDRSLVFKLSCPDRVGLVAQITGFFAHLGGNLLESHQFTDSVGNWFFIRLAISRESLPMGVAELRNTFAPMGNELGAEWTLRDGRERLRMVVLATKEAHCVADLLLRLRLGELRVDVPEVIANHENLRSAVEADGIPFRTLEFPASSKDGAFRLLAERLRELRADVVVLARFMQILPAWFCEEFSGRLINIHHSFLPAFVGANPYRRAWERGVKLIGATCHYATAELDAGPIIDQEVVRVEHFHSPEDLLRLGRDCERLALARGVRWHTNDRVLLHGSRTIVFRD